MFFEGSDKNFPLLKHSTLKLTMLLVLTSTARASEIHLLDVRLLVKHSSGYIFQFRKKTPKNQNKVNQGLLLIFLHWLKTKNCAYHHTDLYLKRTSIMQERITYLVKFYWNLPNNFHNNIIKTYYGSTCCVHRVLTQIKSFSAHSTRAASSSKAKVLGVRTREILNYNFWKILLLLGRNFNRCKISIWCFWTLWREAVPTMTFEFTPDEASNELQIGWRFHEMKFRITPKSA